MISHDPYSKLLITLYSAVESESLWSDFLEHLSRTLNLTGAAILSHNMAHGRYEALYSAGHDNSWVTPYSQYFGPIDMWRDRFLKKKAGEFALGEELCPLHEARTTEFYNDFVHKRDLCLFGAVATLKTPSLIENVSLYKSWKETGPGQAAVDGMALIYPHLKHALDLRRTISRLRAHNLALEAAIDLCDAGIILLDYRGRVARVNKAAESLLTPRNGLTVRDRQIGAITFTDNATLAKLIEQARLALKDATVHPGGSMLVRRPRQRPLALTVLPLMSVSHLLSPTAAIVIFIYDPDASVRPPLQLLRHGYQLTAAEAQLALLLIEGKTLAEAAKCRGVSYNTVRHQLKIIFMKTGTRHQSELIRLLMRTYLTRVQDRGN